MEEVRSSGDGGIRQHNRRAPRKYVYEGDNVVPVPRGEPPGDGSLQEEIQYGPYQVARAIQYSHVLWQIRERIIPFVRVGPSRPSSRTSGRSASPSLDSTQESSLSPQSESFAAAGRSATRRHTYHLGLVSLVGSLIFIPCVMLTLIFAPVEVAQYVWLFALVVIVFARKQMKQQSAERESLTRYDHIEYENQRNRALIESKGVDISSEDVRLAHPNPELSAKSTTESIQSIRLFLREGKLGIVDRIVNAVVSRNPSRNPER